MHAIASRTLGLWIAAALVTGLITAASADPEERVRVSGGAAPEPPPRIRDLLDDELVDVVPVPELPAITIPPLPRPLPPVTIPDLPLPEPVQDLIADVVCQPGRPVAVDHDGLWLIDADRGCARVLMRTLKPGTPTFSPDGRTAIVPAREGGTHGSIPVTLWRVDLVTGIRSALVPPDVGLGHVVWSPDGDWIAYTSHPTEPRLENPTAPDGPHAASEVWLVRPDGSERHRIAAIDGWGLISWAPDGDRMAVTLRNDEHILIADVRTGQQVRHPVPAPYLASWSPDGSRLLFDGGEHNATTVYVLDPVRGSWSSLVPDASFPRWSPDGRHIGVLRNDELVVVDPSGVVIRDDLGTGLPINWSSDSRYLLSAVGNQDYVLDMSTGEYREVASPGDGPGPWPQSSRWIPGTHQFAAIATGARHYTP